MGTVVVQATLPAVLSRRTEEIAAAASAVRASRSTPLVSRSSRCTFENNRREPKAMCACQVYTCESLIRLRCHVSHLSLGY